MKDVYQSIKDDAITLCPNCANETLRRVIYGGIGCFMKDTKTIGSLADKNWSSKGHYEKSEIEAKSLKKEEKSPLASFGSASKKEINKMTDDQKTKYIMTGEK
jgi:predicted nucleic acid-binding Zn ribbon protein